MDVNQRVPCAEHPVQSLFTTTGRSSILCAWCSIVDATQPHDVDIWHMAYASDAFGSFAEDERKIECRLVQKLAGAYR